MPDIAISKLKEIVVSDKQHIYKNKDLHIHEDKKDAVLKHVVINGFEHEVLAIKYDKIGLADKTLVVGHNARKGCDAVIFCQFDGQGYILILDLKSSIVSDIPQLLSGDCFADYLLSILQRFEGIKISWQRRYFILHGHNNKRTTLPDYVQTPPNNTEADKAHFINVSNGEHIPLRKRLNQPL